LELGEPGECLRLLELEAEKSLRLALQLREADESLRLTDVEVAEKSWRSLELPERFAVYFAGETLHAL
jgi:hypothetical protein